MAGIFEIDCPDCGHHWRGVQARLCIGEPSTAAGETQDSYCPCCYNMLSLPKTLERKTWQRWRERFLSKPQMSGEWLLKLLDQVDASFSSASWYTTQPIQLGTIRCPECDLPMVPHSENGDHLICPICGSLNPILTEFTGFLNMFVGDNGFA